MDCVVGDRLKRFDVVVGADGASSVTREFVQPGLPVLSTGQTCWRGIVAMTVGTRGTEVWTGSARIGTVPLPDERTYVYVVTDGRVPGDTGLDRPVGAGGLPSRERAATSLLSALPASSRSRVELRELRHPVWGRGRIALVGDAAHAMTPNLGLGAALAIDDVVALRRLLRDPDRAVLRYRRQRHPVVRATQVASRRLGQAAHGSAAADRGLRCLAGLESR